MYRALLALGAGLLLATTANADGLPPKGAKRVPLDNKITTTKEYPDYLFFTSTGGSGRRAKLTPVKLDPKTPVVLAGKGRSAGIGRQGSLLAVPKDAAKNYDSEEKFHAAIKERTVEGLLQTRTNLDSYTTIKDSDPRTVVVQEYTLEKVNPKEGIVLARKKSEEPKKDGGKDSPDDEDAPGVTAYTPKGGMLIAGGAAALAVMLGGLWLVGRTRRK